MSRKLLLLISLVVITACSRTPSDKELADAIRQSYARYQAIDLFEVKEMRKIHGYVRKGEYRALVHYGLVLTTDINTYYQYQNTSENADPLKNGSGELAMRTIFSDAKVGEMVWRKEELRLRKSSDGWTIVRDGDF